MAAMQPPVLGIRWAMEQAPLLRVLLLALFVATATLWITAYWPVALFEASIFTIAAIAIAQRRAPPRGASYPLLVLSFVVLWGCMQRITGTTVDGFATERATLLWMTWAAVYYIVVSTVRAEALIRIVHERMVWFACALSVWAILQAYLSPGRVLGLFETGYRDFVMGPIVYHSHFAALIESVFPIALSLALGRNKQSHVWIGVSAILLTSIVVSASRGGLMIVFVEVFAVLILSHLRKPQAFRRTGILALGLFAATALLILIVGFETTSERFHSEALSRGRLQFAVSTLHMIAAHPLIGWGLGCWANVYPAFATFDPGAIVNQAHCDWLQWTAEGGLPVGLAMLSLAVWAIKPAVRSVWGIGVLAVLMHAAFDYPFSRPAIGAWPVLVLALAVVQQESRAREKGSSTSFGDSAPKPIRG